MSYKLEVTDQLFNKEGNILSSEYHEGHLAENELHNLLRFLAREKHSNIQLEIAEGKIEQAHLYCLRFAQDGSYSSRTRHIYKLEDE